MARLFNFRATANYPIYVSHGRTKQFISSYREKWCTTHERDTLSLTRNVSAYTEDKKCSRARKFNARLRDTKATFATCDRINFIIQMTAGRRNCLPFSRARHRRQFIAERVPRGGLQWRLQFPTQTLAGIHAVAINSNDKDTWNAARDNVRELKGDLTRPVLQ